MTTICSDGVTVAADSLVTGEFQVSITKLQKIGKSIFGTAGDVAQGELFLDWIRAGKPDEKPPVTNEFEGIEVNASGIYMWTEALRPLKSSRKCAGIGSGGGYATAAMLCGKSPRQAVAIAAEMDQGTGGRIITMKVPK